MTVLKIYIQNNIVLPKIYYFIAIAIGFTLVILGIWLFKNIKKGIVSGMLVAYLVIVLSATILIRTHKELRTYELSLFWSYKEIFRGNHMLFFENIINILMLMPVGIMMAIGFEKINSKKVIITGLLISLTIETIQLISKRGLFELDDLFHNTLGCVIGYLIYQGIKKWLS